MRGGDGAGPMRDKKKDWIIVWVSNLEVSLRRRIGMEVERFW